jgi:hypothetical protein
MPAVRARAADLLLIACTAAPGCAIDDIEHGGGCPERVFPSDYDGSDLEVLRGYTRVAGDLVVPEETEDLSALRCLQRVDRVLSISDAPKLVSLDGLEDLERVGTLSLADLPALTSTSGLSGLRTIDEGLGFQGLASLARVEGLSDLEELGGGVSLVGLHALETWDEPLEIPSLSSLHLLGIADGASIRAFSEVTEIREGVVLTTPMDATVGLRLHLDALTSAPTLDFDAVAAETIGSLGALSEVGQLELTRYYGENLDGLDSLRRIGRLHIESSPNLRSVDGLEGVEELTSLELASNPRLENLDGLSGVQDMPFIGSASVDEPRWAPSISILDCETLADISGLGDTPVTYLADVRLVGVPSLSSLGEWPALEGLGSFELSGSAVRDLDALSNLETLDHFLHDELGQPRATDTFRLVLYGNPELTDLDGLDPARAGALTSVGHWGTIVVQDNPALPTCAVEALGESFAALGQVDGTFEVSGNADTPCE